MKNYSSITAFQCDPEKYPDQSCLGWSWIHSDSQFHQKSAFWLQRAASKRGALRSGHSMARTGTHPVTHCWEVSPSSNSTGFYFYQIVAERWERHTWPELIPQIVTDGPSVCPQRADDGSRVWQYTLTTLGIGLYIFISEGHQSNLCCH